MKHIFLPFLHPIIRVIALTVILTSCGTVQTINGVRIPKNNERPNIKNYILVTGVSFGLGYYLGSEVINKEKWRNQQ